MSGTSLRRLGLTAMLLGFCLAATACGNQKINKANYDKIKLGMSLKEVEDILGGPGTKDEGGDGSGVANQFGVDIPSAPAAGRSRGQTYVWERGESTITIDFDQSGMVVNMRQKGL